MPDHLLTSSRRSPSPRLGLVAALALTACVIDKQLGNNPLDTDGTGSSTGVTDTATQGADTTAGTTDTATQGADTTAGTTDSTTQGATVTGDPLDTTTTGDPIPPGCFAGGATPQLPVPPAVILGNGWLGYVSIEDTCTLTAAQPTDSGLEFSLDCPSWSMDHDPGLWTFEIVSGPVPTTLPAVGSELDVLMEFQVDLLDFYYLILRHEGVLLYAWVSGQHLVPKEASGPEIFAPLALSRTDPCPLVVGHQEGQFPGGGSFVCKQVAPARLRAAMEGATELELADDEAGSVSSDAGTYAIDVQRVWRAMDCQPDFPPGELEIMAFTAARQ